MDHLLSTNARHATTSAIRDLLEHAQQPGMISLAGGLPDPNHFPLEELATSAHRRLLHDGPRTLQYGLTAGTSELRDHLRATAGTDVMVTTGSQQALHLLAQVLLDPGDTAVVGDPDYLGALHAFRARDAGLIALPMDADGLRVDLLAQVLADGLRPKLVYTVPHFHNPTGSTLSTDRRRQLLALAETYEFVVVFDDPYRSLTAGEPLEDHPDTGPFVVELRSVSKVLAPGLRVGWMFAPAWLTDAAERAKQSADLHTSTLTQALAVDALTAPWFDDHLARLRTATAMKRDALCDALRTTFDDELEFNEPDGGMFVWARWADGRDAAAALPAALERGVAYVPGSAFAVERNLDDHLRLSWATASPTELRTGVERLRG